MGVPSLMDYTETVSWGFRKTAVKDGAMVQNSKTG